MALGTCLTDLVARKMISQARADALEPRYRELVAQYEGRYGRAAAEAMATSKTLELADSDLAERKRRELLQHAQKGAWLADMRAKSPDGAPLSRHAAEEAMVDMERHRIAVRAQAFGMISGMLERFRKNLIGEVRNKSDLDNVLGEIFGENTGDLNAREMAQAWRDTAEWLRSRYNAAGGHIAKLDAWHLPQRHDMRLVRDAGFEQWRDFVWDRLDRPNMIDRGTGEAISDGKLELLLRDMWEAIATDGWTRNNPGAIRQGALGNQRADHRVLHFAGPDAWREYADAFGGGGTIMDTMIGHIDGMARDIAAMEKMGPNPGTMLQFQQDWLRKSAAEALLPGRKGEKALASAETGAASLERLYDEYGGANNRPENRRLALGFSIFRAQQTAAKLGGAVLASGGDFGTMALTAGFNGIPARKVLSRYVGLLNPANAEDRALAGRLSLIADQWTSATAGQWRFTGEEIAHEGARRVAEGVLRVSGLVAHSDSMQQAFGMEMLATLTHQRGIAFDQLDPKLQGLLERYKLSGARWDALRHMETREDGGADWLYPEDIARSDQSIADDLMRMLTTEADYAVPVPDLRTRAMINTRAPKGTWMGEIARSVFLFKGFPLAVLNIHGRRMLDLAGADRVKYGLALLTLTTLGGALSLQLKAIAAGKDPVDMTDRTFLARAAVQGGGLGIFGDLLKSSESRAGTGVAGTLLGPGAQVWDETIGATTRNVSAMADGDEDTDTQWKKDAVRLAMNETPGISLWYTRLAVERTFGDLAREWSDENVEQSYRNMEKYASEQGGGYWAPPGSLTGRNGATMQAPDFGNMLGSESAPEIAQ